MENDQRKISNEDLFTGTTTPSFSRKLGTFYETMEKIPEQNESIYEEHKSNESKSSYHGYKTGKSLQLFAVKTLYKLDSESIVKEVQKNKYCCIEKVKKKDEKSSEKTFCEINACRIF